MKRRVNGNWCGKFWVVEEPESTGFARVQGDTMGRFVGVLGLLTMLGLAYLFSTDRKAIKLKTVAWGLGLQLSFAIFVLRFPIGRYLFEKAGYYVNLLLSYAFYGSQFVFGELGLPAAPTPG